jgi:hypothetical protein
MNKDNNLIPSFMNGKKLKIEEEKSKKTDYLAL